MNNKKYKNTTTQKIKPAQTNARISLPAPWMNASSDALCDAFLSLKTRDEMRAFIRDLCTEQEIEEMANRFTVAGMLYAKLPYQAIEQKTSMSTATIARINQWLRGGMGGYRIALSRTNLDHTHHTQKIAKGGV